MTTYQIGSRIKALREQHNLSQDSLARLFGFKDRQTISAIETGRTARDSRGTAARRREARRAAGIFH